MTKKTPQQYQLDITQYERDLRLLERDLQLAQVEELRLNNILSSKRQIFIERTSLYDEEFAMCELLKTEKKARQESTHAPSLTGFKQSDFDNLLRDLAVIFFVDQQIKATKTTVEIVGDTEKAKLQTNSGGFWASLGGVLSDLTENLLIDTSVSVLEKSTPVTSPQQVREEIIVPDVRMLIPRNSYDVQEGFTMKGVTLTANMVDFDFTDFLATQFPAFVSQYIELYGNAPCLPDGFQIYDAFDQLTLSSKLVYNSDNEKSTVNSGLLFVKKQVLDAANYWMQNARVLSQTTLTSIEFELNRLQNKYMKTLVQMLPATKLWGDHTRKVNAELETRQHALHELVEKNRKIGIVDAVSVEKERAGCDEAARQVVLQQENVARLQQKKAALNIKKQAAISKIEQIEQQRHEAKVAHAEAYMSKAAKTILTLTAAITNMSEGISTHSKTTADELSTTGMLSNATHETIQAWIVANKPDDLQRELVSLEQSLSRETAKLAADTASALNLQIVELSTKIAEFTKSYDTFALNYNGAFNRSATKRHDLVSNFESDVQQFQTTRDASWMCYFKDTLEHTLWGKSEGEIRRDFLAELKTLAETYRETPITDNQTALQTKIAEGRSSFGHHGWFEPSLDNLLDEFSHNSEDYVKSVTAYASWFTP